MVFQIPENGFLILKKCISNNIKVNFLSQKSRLLSTLVYHTKEVGDKFTCARSFQS